MTSYRQQSAERDFQSWVCERGQVPVSFPVPRSALLQVIAELSRLRVRFGCWVAEGEEQWVIVPGEDVARIVDELVRVGQAAVRSATSHPSVMADQSFDLIWAYLKESLPSNRVDLAEDDCQEMREHVRKAVRRWTAANRKSG